MKHRLRYETKQKVLLVAAAVVSLLLCILFGSTLFQYTRPMDDAVYDLSFNWEGEAMPEDWVYDQKGWTVFTADGELTADEVGGFYGAVEPMQTFYFSRTLTEDLSDPTLHIRPGGYSIAVFLDDVLLYTDQPEQTGGVGTLNLTNLEWWRDTAVTVSLPANYEGKTLTIAQSTGLPEIEREHFVVYPCAVSLYCGYAYESGIIAESFGSSIPATLLFVAGVLLLVAFVVRLRREQFDSGLLWAALTVFLWMLSLLSGMSFAGEYRGEGIIDWGSVCRLLAMSALLAFLTSRAGKHRRIMWGVSALSAVCCGVFLFLEWKYEFIESDFVSFLSISLPQLVGIVGLIAVLVLSWVYWRKEKRFYALFAPLASAGIVIALVWAVISNGSEVWQQLGLAVTYLMPAYFLWPMALVFTLAAVISTAVELTEQEISRRADSRMMRERSELALQSYESMRAQNEQVRMLRHDMMNHFTALRQMTGEQSVADYLDKLIGQNEKIRPVVRSGNQMLDIILNAKLSQAMDAGVTVEVLRCTAPEKLPLTNAELCSVVMNLTDNAIHAATAPGIENPYINLDLHIKNDHFVFTLENSMGTDTKKETVPEHGLGLKIVHSILERFEDLMTVEQTADSYKVIFAVKL